MSKEISQLNDYLNLIPIQNENIEMTVEEGSRVLLVPMDSPLDFLAKRLRGNHRKLKLDELGAFVWALCDGKKNIREIGEAVKEVYGKAAEPIYERLIYFILELKKRHLLTFK